MKHKLLALYFITTCLIFSSLSYAKAQEGIELPEIKGFYSQDYQKLKIEITGIKRIEEYQPCWQNSGRPRGHKIKAEPGFEIALVQIHTKMLGDTPGINVNHLYIYDSKGKVYEALIRSLIIGTNGESKLDLKENDYKFSVIVPRGTQFSAVQLSQSIVRDTQPFIVNQKITFDVNEFGW